MKKLLLFACTLAVGYKGLAQSYMQLAVSGFNADVVANGTGHTNLSTSHSVDSQTDAYCFVAQNFVNSAGKSPSSYLPANGVINSAATPGLNFQLAPYSGNNSLRVLGSSSGTLTLNTPQAVNQLCVLVTTAFPSTSTVTVNFTDATTQVFTGQSLPNWYGGAGFAIKGISRVHRGTDVIDNNANDPRIYQFLLTMDAANTAKPVQSITFANTTANSFLHVMAVSALVTLANDISVTDISGLSNQCGLTNQENICVTVKNNGTVAQSNFPVSYKINTGTPVTEIFSGSLAPGATASYCFTTKANLSAFGSYTIEAKTNMPGDALITNDVLTKTVNSSAVPNTPTITTLGPSTLCSGGAVALTAASTTTGVTYQWHLNGSPITGATTANYIATAGGSYTVTAIVAGNCSSLASAATVLTLNAPPNTPALTANGPLSFCLGGSVSLIATASSGSTFTWFKNGNVIPGVTTGTYTATTAGSYTVTATRNDCVSPVSAAANVSVKNTPATPSITQNGFVLTSSSPAGNQWYKDGVLIPGATNSTFTTSSNGTYTVVVTSNGCSSGTSNAVNITTTGLGEEIAALDVVVYPNPSNGMFNLTFRKGQVYELVVTDLTGKEVLRQTAKEATTQVNLNKAAKGLYLLKLESEGKTAVRKLILE